MNMLITFLLKCVDSYFKNDYKYRKALILVLKISETSPKGKTELKYITEKDKAIYQCSMLREHRGW